MPKQWFFRILRSTAIGGVSRDIAKRKTAEETFLRLASIVEFSQDAIIGKTKEGVVTSWNRGAEKMYGYKSTEAIGRDLSFLVPPDRQGEVQAIMELIRTGQLVDCFETQRLTKACSLLDVSLSISPIKDGSGRIIGASTIARDITARKNADKQLRLQSAALEAAVNAIVIADRDGSIVWVNQAFTAMTGYSKEEVLGKDPSLLKSGEQPESYYAKLWSTILSGQVWRGELVNKRKDGTIYTEEMTITPVTQKVGTVVETHFIAIKQDISERKQAERALRRAEEKYRTIFEDAVVGIFQTTTDGQPLNVNRAMAEMYGFDSPEQLLAEVSNVVLQLFVDPKRMDALRRMLGKESVVRGAEVEVYKRDWKKKWLLMNLRAVRDASGKIVLHEGTAEDITDRKVAEERVRFLAHFDPLTGLPNRNLLQDRLSQALAGARRRQDKVAVLFLDLDQFKTVNDSLGHSFGDLLLQEVAERLKAGSRELDTVARLGGDEFVLILTTVKDLADVAVAAERFVKLMTDGFVVQGHPLNISCSLGISIFPEDGADCEALMKNADAAMYCAKENGRNTFRFFTEDITTVRLNVEENQLVNVFSEFCVCVGSLKSAQNGRFLEKCDAQNL
jgi:diguanylate cyclase (GGDEF)-like protein/PAS domain S-box-containing protein